MSVPCTGKADKKIPSHLCVHPGLRVPGTLLDSEQEVTVSAFKRGRRQESMSVNLGQCDKCYYRDMEGETKRGEGIRGGFLEEKTLELQFEVEGERCQPEEEGLACILELRQACTNMANPGKYLTTSILIGK